MNTMYDRVGNVCHMSGQVTGYKVTRSQYHKIVEFAPLQYILLHAFATNTLHARHILEFDGRIRRKKRLDELGVEHLGVGTEVRLVPAPPSMTTCDNM
jgi:hypothetical protein